MNLCGIQDEILMEEIESNNLLKVHPEYLENCVKDENGKLIKPIDFPEPDIKYCLA